MSFKLIWSLKKRAYRITDPTPRVARRLDATWLLDPTDWLDLQILIGRPFEERQIQRLAELCREHEVRRFVDCGANFGLYSVLLPLMVPEIAHVDAFEPVSAARWRLHANLGLNGLTESTTVHPVALSDHEGEMQIAIDPTSTGISSLSPSAEERARRGFMRHQSVRCARLDSHLPDLSGPVAFKIDVEGHEPALFAGMRETLRRTRAIIQIEARPRNREKVEGFFADCGYAQIDQIDHELYFAPSPVLATGAADPAATEHAQAAVDAVG